MATNKQGIQSQVGSGGMKGGTAPKTAGRTGRVPSRFDTGNRTTENNSKDMPGGLAELPRSGGIINQTPPKTGGGAPPQFGKFVGSNRGTEGDNSMGYGGGLANTTAQGGSSPTYPGTDDASK